MNKHTVRALAGLTLAGSVLGLTACAGYDSPMYSGNTMGNQVAVSGTGTVTDVRQMGGSTAGNYAGAALGAVVGGVAGNQYANAHDRNRRLPTGLGVVAGALIGEAIQQRTTGVANGQPFYRVTIQLDNGQVRTIDYGQMPDVVVGQRVRVDGNQVYR